MGAGSSLSEGEVQSLVDTTEINRDELKQWYTVFIKDYPTGKLDKSQFKELYSKIYLSDAHRPKTDLLFRVFDQDQDGRVSFEELMCTLSLTTRGTVREKMEWVFEIYDLDGNGLITNEELTGVVTAINYYGKKRKSKGTDVTLTGTNMGTNVTLTRMNSVFKQADSDNNGYLTVEEFVAGVESNPELVQLLNYGQENPVVTCD